MTRALVVIDGEHYPPVVRDAIAGLPYEVVGAWFAGGTEKLRGGVEDYGVPLVETIEDGFAEAEVVVDLSDEPVLGPRERMLLASRVLAGGLRYEGADFRFEPPQYEPFPASVAGRDRHGEADREDGGHGSRRATAGPRPRRRRRRDGARGSRGAAGGGGAADARVAAGSVARG